MTLIQPIPDRHHSHPVSHADYHAPDMSFEVSWRTFSTHSCSHAHAAAELLFLFAGTRTFFINDRTVTLTPGGMLLIDRDTLHKTSDERTTAAEGVLVYLRGSPGARHEIESALGGLFGRPFSLFRFDAETNAEMERAFSRIRAEIKDNAPGRDLAIRCQLESVFVSLARLEPFETASSAAGYQTTAQERVSRAATHILSHFDEDLSLDSVAESFFMSPTYFSRLFRKVSGYTFVEYLTAVRIREAIRLLQNTDRKVSDIASAVGFATFAHFSRVFKETVGHPPSYFRAGKTAETA